ncbi:hypothetical protein EVG20_g10650 [Dentipellis fragilis]|uniref:Uncharacterized protein n=1 Tax=Dentipellis fragilis TaxID=205917 RepID=A0A4Y9XR15_9AGAM|nr:hypothetical protein EVG20_g10650 [Dentipellis fragilis]
MSYHPHATAHGQQHAPSAQHMATSASQTSADFLADSLTAVQSRAVNYDHVVLPSRAQLDQEIYEAKLARDQGRISPLQYCEVIARCMLVGNARSDRAKQGLRKSIRGEDTRELRKRDFDLNDSELDESLEQARRRVDMKMENKRRSEQGMYRRTVTRGL